MPFALEKVTRRESGWPVTLGADLYERRRNAIFWSEGVQSVSSLATAAIGLPARHVGKKSGPANPFTASRAHRRVPSSTLRESVRLEAREDSP